MTIKQAIKHIRKNTSTLLANKDADTMKILSYVIGLNETGIFKSLEKTLTTDQVKKLNNTISRLKKHEPIEYITKSAFFYGHSFIVSKNTLIPRQETEGLVEQSLSKIYEKLFSEETDTDDTIPNVIDIGTGTGCIIVSIALAIREPVKYFAVDISKRAVSIAEKNIKEYKLTNDIQLFEGNLFEPVNKRVKFDVIVANLPYILQVDLLNLPLSVREYEPEIALDGGKNGTRIIQELLIRTKTRIRKNGVILLEIQPKIIDRMKVFLKRFYPNAKITCTKDYFETKRFIVIQT